MVVISDDHLGSDISLRKSDCQKNEIKHGMLYFPFVMGIFQGNYFYFILFFPFFK